MAFKGASSFRMLADNLGELLTIPSRITRAVSDDINGFIAEEFSNEQDPYGDEWAPLAPSTIRRKGHDTIMVETGQTRDETIAYPLRGAGIEIRSTQQAGYNQFVRSDGTPARPVLPSEAELPDEWQDSIRDRFREAVERSRKR